MRRIIRSSMLLALLIRAAYRSESTEQTGRGLRSPWVDDYEVWVGHLSDGSGGVWNPPNDTAGAVQCGNEGDGTPLFAARANHDGGWHIGKWRKDWTAAAIPYGGSELWIDQFEVLCPGQYFEGDPIFSWQG